MFLFDLTEVEDLLGLPRIRGGVSIQVLPLRGQAKSSPHTRGCFPAGLLSDRRKKVFPAYAGVFLMFALQKGFAIGLPRIRGGVSRHGFRKQPLESSSPHTRGCFLRSSISG